jgi:hypothetical protein
MDELKQPRPVAFLDWQRTTNPEAGLSMGTRAQDITVWMRCYEDSFRFSWMQTRLHPGAGPKDAQLLLICPFCSRDAINKQDLRIPGSHKTFEWGLMPPRRIPIPSRPDAINTVQITIAEPCGCPRCKKMFKITTNVISKA